VTGVQTCALPIYSLITGDITGIEALIRWQHPEMGMIAPDKFIPLAEESGIIIPMTEWVLHTACTQMVAIMAAGYSTVANMAVNISGRHFQRGTILDAVKKALNETGLAPENLDIEITEGIIMQDDDQTIALFDKLERHGVAISIDDFGTGYSSLSYLKRLPVHTLKVDRSFVRDIPGDPNDVAICRAIIAMGKALNLELIAEGVETEEQQTFLQSLGCGEAQGYLFSRPLPSEELLEFLEKNKKRSSKTKLVS